MAPLKVGVLGLQGSFKEHLAAVARLGDAAVGVDVRTPEAHAEVDALIIPGGESTAIAVGLEDAGLLGPVRAIGAPIIALCESADSPLGGGADLVLSLGQAPEAWASGPAAAPPCRTTSRPAQAAGSRQACRNEHARRRTRSSRARR